MKLLKFTLDFPEYYQFKWNAGGIDGLNLQDVNLLVGRNASGKTTIANNLSHAGKLLSNLRDAISMGSKKLELINGNGDKFEYTFNGDFDGYTEELLINGVERLYRDHTSARLFSITKNKFEFITPPNDKLIIQVRRDKIEYPYLEELSAWADGIYAFRFGHVHGTSFSTDLDNEELTSVREFNKILGELKESSKKTIIEEFNELDYKVTLLDIRKEGNQNVLYIKEDNVKYEIRQNTISQGMFRALSLIIYIHYLVEIENAQLIIIDDLCEGLDYDRSTRLGKLLFAKMLKKGVQFLATSNDYFLMNAVDIKYWNLVYRENGAIKTKDYTNNKDKFDSFKLTGLSNFALYSSNFID